MELEKEVQEEIEKFREILPCKKEKFCLPIYIITEKIRFHKYGGEYTKNLFEKGHALYKRINEKRKKLLYDEIFKIINGYMKPVLYPGEKEIKPECENSDCPTYSVIRIMDKGVEFSKFMTAQSAAVDIFKWKKSESLKRDIGDNDAWYLWTQEKIIVEGNETTRAAEFRRDYNLEKEKEIEEFGKNHNLQKLSKNHSLGEVKNRIIRKI